MTSAGWEGVSLVAIDETWSAMRFRPVPIGGPRPRSHPKQPLVVPPPVAKRIAASKKAKTYWESLAPSHKREYVTWITDAKKDETRTRRMDEMIEMLEAGKKRS
jgi:uncharacterized protein YdeI (YjbR/CyaY-like superfamily)